MSFLRFKKILSIVMYYFFGGDVSARFMGVRVGVKCRIYIKDFGSEPFLVSIGNNVTVTSGVKFLTHDGALSLVRNDCGRYYKYAPISIGDNVFIGVNSIVLPGVSVGDNVVIAAGSVVTKDIESNKIVAGVPARVIEDFSEWKIKVIKKSCSEKDLIGVGGGYLQRVNGAILIAAKKCSKL